MHLARFSDLFVVLAMKLVGIVLVVGSAWMVFSIIFHLTRWRLPAVIAAVLLALQPLYMADALSGMEVPLVGFTMVWSVYALVTQRWRMLALALGATALSRPEGILFAALVMTFLAIRELTQFALDVRNDRIDLTTNPGGTSGVWATRFMAFLRDLSRPEDEQNAKADVETGGPSNAAPVEEQNIRIAQITAAAMPVITRLSKIGLPFLIVTVVYLAYMKMVNGS